MAFITRRSIINQPLQQQPCRLWVQEHGAAGPLKIAFVYLGPIGDHGWTYAHEQGRQDLIKHFGNKIETTIVENVAEGPDAERVIRNLAKQGNELIFTTSFGYMNPTLKVAKALQKSEI